MLSWLATSRWRYLGTTLLFFALNQGLGLLQGALKSPLQLGIELTAAAVIAGVAAWLRAPLWALVLGLLVFAGLWVSTVMLVLLSTDRLFCGDQWPADPCVASDEYARDVLVGYAVALVLALIPIVGAWAWRRRADGRGPGAEGR